MTARQDLGIVDGPMLIFGGPYGNRQATEALLARAAALDITPDRMLCTGDLAAYAADPQETADLLRDAGVAVVMGNVEESLGFAADDCGCGFEDGSACDLLAARWYRYAAAAVSSETKRWMRDLPRRIDFTLAGLRFAAIHGGVERINEFIFPATPAAEKRAVLDATGADATIGGHSGLPFVKRLEDRLWVNPGVIGLPANDGTPRVWYGLLVPQPHGIDIRIEALSYDHAAAAAAIRAADLPPDYAETLETGLWPNDDVMPASDRARRGIPLEASVTTWHGRKPMGAAAD